MHVIDNKKTIKTSKSIIKLISIVYVVAVAIGSHHHPLLTKIQEDNRC